MLRLTWLFSLVRRLGLRRSVIGLLHLPAYIRLFGRLYMDPRVPRLPKTLVGAAALCILSPLGVIPDFLPVIGELGEAGVMILVIRRFMAMVPPHVRLEHEIAVGLARPAHAHAAARRAP